MNPNDLVHDFVLDHDPDWYDEWCMREGTLDELIKRYNQLIAQETQ